MPFTFRELTRAILAGYSAAPYVVSVSTATAAEGSTLIHTVTLSAPITVAPITLAFSLTDGTATAGLDYGTPTFSAGITLGAGAINLPTGSYTAFTVSIPALTDALTAESTEAYTLSVGGISAGGSITNVAVPSMYMVLSSASNCTFARGTGNGTINRVAGGVINISVSPSRTTGVAPLYVNFDMTATTSTAITDADPVIQTARRVHELLYVANFGDPGSGNWASGVQSSGLTSKNTAFGPVVGHVYETPGTYTPSLLAMDGVNPSSVMGGVITVLDPEVVFNAPYGDTYYLSTSGTFTGALGSLNRITVGTSDMYSLINTYKASNRRILFCKADNWTCSAQIVLSNLSNMTIDGYGPGGDARAFGTGTLVRCTPAAFAGYGNAVFLTTSGNSDLRICNIKMTAGSSHKFGVVNDTVDGVLWFKNEIRGSYGGFESQSNSGNTPITPTGLCFYECVVDNLFGLPFYDMPGVTATFAASTDTFSATAHGFAISTPVKLRGNTVNSAPAGLNGTMGVTYYVSATNYTADALSLSLTPGGAVIDLTDNGTCIVAPIELHGGVSIYTALLRGGIMGCYFDNCNHGEQTMRIPVIDRGHINNNHILRPNQQKNVLKVHSSIHEVFPIWSEKFVISANFISLRGGYSYDGVSVNEAGFCSMVVGSGGNGHTDGSGGEYVRNAIIENNFTQGCLGGPKATLVFAEVNCPHVTVRNNIADFSVGDRSTPTASLYGSTVMAMVNIATSTRDQTTGVRVYNNTLYSNLTNASFSSFIGVYPPSGSNPVVNGVYAENNLWYLPGRGASSPLYYNHLTTGTGLNGTTNTPNSLTSPGFVNTPPRDGYLDDWRPTASWAINTGTAVPVLRDINQASRVGGTYDFGAVLP